MYGKLYKLLIIRNAQSTILFIPTRNNGIMEWWNDEEEHGYPIIWIKINQDNFKKNANPPSSQSSKTQYSNIPTFHYSNQL
jgi:hypothetical protein